MATEEKKHIDGVILGDVLPEYKAISECMEKFDGFSHEAIDLGFDILIAVRHPTKRTLFTLEHRVSNDSPPVCHRFNEVASCRSTLVDIALLLRDCFTEVVNANKEKEE